MFSWNSPLASITLIWKLTENSIQEKEKFVEYCSKSKFQLKFQQQIPSKIHEELDFVLAFFWYIDNYRLETDGFSETHSSDRTTSHSYPES